MAHSHYEAYASVRYKMIGNEVTGFTADVVACNKQESEDFINHHLREPWPYLSIEVRAGRQEIDAYRSFVEGKSKAIDRARTRPRKQPNG